MSVLSVSIRVYVLPKTVNSSASNTYEEAKRLGIWTAAWAADNGHLHILEYLIERKFDQHTKMRVYLQPKKAT